MTPGWISNVYDSGDHMTYDVKVSGPTTLGTVVATVSANKAQDGAGNGNTAAPSSASVTWQPVAGNTKPTVTIDPNYPAFGSVYAKGSTAINPLVLKAKFTDPDNGHWSWKVNWDDSSGTCPTANANTCPTSSGTYTGNAPATDVPFSATHTFSNPGVYTINVTVKDGLGA